ncbi:MAG: hypothetical protein QG552_3397 [Thermodesulfobacteriota bacterium]|nr:hypothetical protein [Thermodesulfobacteriota bacterium]
MAMDRTNSIMPTTICMMRMVIFFRILEPINAPANAARDPT